MSRQKPNLKNRVPDYIGQAVIDLAIAHPALGQVRASNELAQKGMIVSPSGIRSIGLRYDLESLKKRYYAY